MDYAREVEGLLKALSRPKAAALSCLCAMMWLRRFHLPVWEIWELSNVTGFSTDAIGEAKPILLHSGLVRGAGAAGRYGLILEDRAVAQLGLWDAAPVGEVVEAFSAGLGLVGNGELSTRVESDRDRETGFSGLETGKTGLTPHVVVSSCCFSSSAAPETTTTTTDARPEKPVSSELPVAYERAWQVLVEELGMSAQLADRVARKVYDEDWGGVWLEFQALRWLVYCCSPRGESIRNVPAFVASRLAEGQGAPGFVRADSGDMRHRIDSLWREVQREDAERDLRRAG